MDGLRRDMSKFSESNPETTAALAERFFEFANQALRALATFTSRLQPALFAANGINTAYRDHGYATLFKPSSIAGLQAFAARSIGDQSLAERVAARRLASAVRLLAKQTTRLTAQRKARDLVRLIGIYGHLGLMDDASRRAEIDLHLYTFQCEELSQGRGSWQQVVASALRIADQLPDPRGRPSSLISETRLILLTLAGDNEEYAGYTCLELNGNDYTDRYTRATRIVFNNPRFDPRPSCRAKKKRLIAT